MLKAEIKAGEHYAVPWSPPVRPHLAEDTCPSVTARLAMPEDTARSDFVSVTGPRTRGRAGSRHPTPATTQNPRSRAYARLYDWDADGPMRCHGLVVSVGAFPAVRALDAQAAYRRWPMAAANARRGFRARVPEPNRQTAEPQVRRGHGAGARCEWSG
jgi:hypothetical protein